MAEAAACRPTEPTRADPPSEPPLRFPPRPLGPLPRARSLLATGEGEGGTPWGGAAFYWLVASSSAPG